MKTLLIILATLVIASVAFADVIPAPLEIVESDSSPSTFPYKLIVPNSSLTDNLDGTATLDFVAGIGGIGGVNGDLEFNDNSLLGGITNTDYDKSTGNFTWSTDNFTFEGMNSFISYILITATSGVDTKQLTIGANTLDTTEWAFLDGQDQAVKTTSSPTFANITATSIIAGSGVFTGSLTIPSGTAPIINGQGMLAQDTTDDQLIYGSTPRVITYRFTRCGDFDDLIATDDNVSLGMWSKAVTITGVGCSYVGTGTTKATITLEDGSGNAMTITGTNPTCVAHGTNATFSAVTAGNSLLSGEILRFDVTNTPSPTTDDYSICVQGTYDRQ